MKTPRFFMSLSYFAFFFLVLVPALHAGIVVTNPGISGAIVDPTGSTTVDRFAGSCDVGTFNGFANLRVLSFDQAAFTVGQLLDQVNLTALGNTITFTGLTIAGNDYNATSGTNSLVAVAAVQDTVSASIRFATPVDHVGVTVSNLNMGGLDVQFYDAAGLLLYHTSQYNAQGGDPNGGWSALDGSYDNFYSFASGTANIAEIRFVPLYTSGMLISVDDLAFTQSYTFTGTGGDDTNAIQALVNGLAPGDTLQINGNARVSTVAFWYKDDIIVAINGSLESLFTSEQTSKPYAGPSGNPVLGIFGGSAITITGSYIRNTHNEAIAAFSVSYLTICCNIYGAGVGRFCGIYANDCSDLTISNCEIRQASYKPATGYYVGGEGIALYGINGGIVANCYVHDNGSNGIYEYSGIDTDISGNHIYSNCMSGIQFNFNAGVGATTDFTIANNYIYNNRADGIDLNNNSGTAYDVWGLVQGNYLSRNGWESNGAATPDGSGVATCVYLNQIQLLGNLSAGSCRTGIFFSHCGNGYAYGNVVSKTAASLDYVAYDEYGDNVQFECNDLYYYDSPYPRENLKAWYINDVVFKDQYVRGGCIVYPGWPGTPPAGLILDNTPKAAPNYYRYTTSSTDDFAVIFGTPTSGYASRVVAWTNSSAHSISLPLSGTVKMVTMSGLVSYITSRKGKVTVPLTASPVMLDVP